MIWKSVLKSGDYRCKRMMKEREPWNTGKKTIIITGGIGSGKSFVARILRLKGYGVFDCDAEAKRLMETMPSLIDKIKSVAGESVYEPNPSESKRLTLNRSLLAQKIFSDNNIREKVNSAVHAAVKAQIKDWLKYEKNIFIETAIAEESGLADMADEIWIVTASEETRIKRVSKRDRRPLDQILKIIEVQKEEEKKLCKRNPVFIKNDPEDNILSKINNLKI